MKLQSERVGHPLISTFPSISAPQEWRAPVTIASSAKLTVSRSKSELCVASARSIAREGSLTGALEDKGARGLQIESPSS